MNSLNLHKSHNLATKVTKVTKVTKCAHALGDVRRKHLRPLITQEGSWKRIPEG